MAKQIAFGVIWCVVFYFGLCMIVGAVAGGMAASNMQPGDDPHVVGALAGAHAVHVGRLLIAAGAIFFAAAGSILEVLPGTRVRRTRVIEIR